MKELWDHKRQSNSIRKISNAFWNWSSASKKENEQLKSDIRGYQDFLRALATVMEPFETEGASDGVAP